MIDGLECSALVDTGSRVDLISRDLYDEIEEYHSGAIHEPLEPVVDGLQGAQGAAITLCGTVSLLVHVTTTATFTAKFLVAESLMKDMIWGDRLLGGRGLDTVIDLGRRSLHSRRLGLTMPLEMPTRRSWARKRRKRMQRLARQKESLRWADYDESMR